MTFVKIELEAVGLTREAAIKHALNVLAGMIEPKVNAHAVSSIDGSASAKISKEKH
jgi:hypothetical protein